MIPFLLALSLTLGLDQTELTPEQLARLVKASERSIVRLETENVRWAVVFQPENAPAREMHVLRGGSSSFYEMKIPVNGRSLGMFSVLCRNDQWFLNDGPHRGKYRPYEAPFPLATGAFHIELSQLQFASEAMLSKPGIREEKSEGDRITLRVPVDGVARLNLRANLDKAAELRNILQKKNKPIPPEVLAKLAETEDQLATGKRVLVDRQTGQILETGSGTFQLHFKPIEWLGKGNQYKLDEPQGDWPDHSQPFRAEELNDLIQIANNPGWKPGMRSGDLDLMLVNVKTNSVRRAPFPRGLAMPGCFSKDRLKIYVVGSDTATASLRLYEINLQTRETRPIGDQALNLGNWIYPVMSPAGDRLGIVQMFVGSGFRSQIHVIDLATGKSRTVGQPMDVAMLNWSPRGDALIGRLREPNEEGVSTSYVIRVAMDGEVTKLCQGEFPEVLVQDQRILFQGQDAEKRFQTCDLDGTNIQPFGNGFQGFGFPSASGDGRLIMLKFT
ncbi:MAG: hypothetical protein JWM11_5802, partial [Planctomycetaceae bacterium]|nr:hypothetical protein [Planctomycetaceae bacterium]